MQDYIVTITKNDDSTVTIEGSITWDAFSRFEKDALGRLGTHLELDGFRKGHVPEDIALKHLGDDLVLTDMAEQAIAEFYPQILKDNNIDAIGRPVLTITKMARGNDLGFTLRTAVLPEITLPEYKDIAKTIPLNDTAPVTVEDIDKVVEHLRQMRAYGHVHDQPVPDHAEGSSQEEAGHKHDEPLPEVNDEFAKSFGEFTSVADLRAKIEENVGKEKVQEALDKRRVAILDAVVEKTSFFVPQIILQSEQEKLFSQIEADVARAGLSMDDYLKHAGKTKEQVLEEFKPEAEKRARMQLVVNAIAKKEHITPTDEEVDVRAQSLMAMYPGVDKARATAYADMVITNEKVIALLETEK